jgi:two-component system, LytTR family, response regulator
MNVIIIEDEVPAAEKLERYLQKYDADLQVIATLQTVADSVSWLRENQEKADVIFMDVQLTDGLSFQIFQQVTVRKPVIFTTAYNEFALDAFKVNSIGYLLKPVTFTDVSASLNKLSVLREEFLLKGDGLSQIQESYARVNRRSYKSRFMVKLGEHIRSIPTDQINVFFAEGRDVYLVTNQERKFIIDYTLESLEEIVDPSVFFRLNRTFILNINAIKDVLVYSNSRLKILLSPEFPKEIIVSREKVNDFKEWFDGAS